MSILRCKEGTCWDVKQPRPGALVASPFLHPPQHFSEPAIFLYALECFEGKEIELSGEVRSLQAEGFNNHVLSVRIKGGV
jgi:hypothetical protein